MSSPITAFPIPTTAYPASANTRLVTGSTTVLSTDAVILVNSSSPCTITLPDLSGSWPTGFFSRFVWVKDYGGNAAGANITIVPVSPQQIDLMPQLVIVSNHGIARLYPTTDLTAWYVA